MGRKAVLVVEDDRDIREDFQELLEREGYQVLLAPNGHVGLTLLRDTDPKPGLIFLDLMMPVMDGKTFLALVAALPALATIPIVVFTTADTRFGSNVVETMRKPVDIGRILTAVAQHCG